MAKTIKCKSCKTVNDKYAKQCRSCGTLLYPEISHKNAELITIILDGIFAFIYLFGIYLFIVNSNNNETPKYITILPAPNTLPYFLIILLFLAFAVSKILYIVNVFVLKKDIIFTIRRFSMFIEAVIMFPLQTILALYFYEPATNHDKMNKKTD
ncbi:hypothetical protein BFL38_01590 [Brachyspira hampsonii]|uniref:Uncharacterized protein n=1 Tax=Brachyspira hampsonii TaxID=1287055 RepID=A0A1E5NBL0_9SPIR|nr:hypothetical protein [Brachyspira hampsonii]OEJ13467.1 hypothetical protein BFL38_01590 [Brachyspira hampsonii]